MVYYSTLPLLTQSEQQQQSSTQVSSNPNTDLINVRNLSSTPINYQVPQSSLLNHNHHQNDLQTHHQQNYNHHQLGSNIDQHQQQDQSTTNFNNFQPQLSNNKIQKPQFKCEQCSMIFGSKSAHTSHTKSHAKQQQQYQIQNNTNNSSVVPIQQTNQMIINSSVSNINSGVSVNGGGGGITNPAEPYQCDVCKKTFAVPARLVRHYRTHTGERPFACEFCLKTFSVKENLQVHRRIHTKERPYKCDVCGRAFEHSGKLHRHMRIHTGERPHKCSVCGKTFIQSGQLVIHMRTHTGEKPYKCPVEGCGKGFTCSKQLKVHSRTHTGEKPYHCDICFRDFGYNHVLKLHRVQHYGSKCYKCTICEETFKNKKEMEAHIKGHANDLPDDDDEHNDESMLDVEMQPRDLSSPTSSSLRNESSSIRLMQSPSSSSSNHMLSETPKDSGSEGGHSDGDDVATYYNMYSRFEQSVNNYGVHTGVNPALLAAASIAAVAQAAGYDDPRSPSVSPPLSLYHSSNSRENTPTPHQSMHPPTSMTLTQSSSGGFVYEPMASMRQHGYFAPVSQTSEFRSSAVSANLVRRVEEAIAIAEPLLTPPRSSPESPSERSSSPESDTLVMADRDIMSLPPRKRKLYLKENHSGDPSPVMRMSSVIQFAKAS